MGKVTSITVSLTLKLTLVMSLVVYHVQCIGVREQGKTARLTTFGNPQPNKPQATTFPPPQAKECRTDQDCHLVQNSSCKKDPHDSSKMRCLCGDRTAPKTGSCKHSKTGLHARCSTDEECVEDAVCKVPTNTTNSNAPSYKSCMCKEGFEEVDNDCNGGALAITPSLYSGLLILAWPALKMIQY